MRRTARRTWPDLGWEAWVAAAAAAAVILTCTFNSLSWINRPFPGFFLWENLFVPAVGNTNWTGYQAGVPFPSRLTAVNGTPVTSAAAVYRIAAALPVGADVTYTFTGDPASAPVLLTIPTMRLTVPEYLWTLGTYLGIGVLLTLLGFVVYALRPDAPAAHGLLSAVGVWGLYLVTAADIFGPAWFRPLCLILQAISPVTLLHLGWTFPVQRNIVRRRPRLLPVLYGLAACVGVAQNVIFTRSFAGMLAFNQLHALGLVGAGLVLIVSLADSFVRPASPAARQRVKIAALGGAAVFVLPVAGFVLFALLGYAFPLNFLALPLALFPAAIGYAIVMNDLFEVDTIIRRTLAWAILTAVIAAVYLGGVGTLEVLFAGRSGRIGQLLFLLVIVATFNPLRNRVQTAVDYLFARDRYDYRQTVGAASQALATLLDLDAVVERILRTITDTIHVDLGAVWLRRNGDFQLQAVAGDRPTGTLPQRLKGDSVLVQRLAASPQHILSVDGLDEPEQPLAGELESLGATLVVPMTFEHRLTGLLALGDKQAGGFYSREDVALLRTLANQGAVAVENARSYRALEHANEELQAAQSRLIETERLAAIGELSAAVAHGIRNPLAGIKAAAQFAALELPAEHPLHENIADIIGETDKLESRIRTLLDFAKPFEPRPVACHVHQIVADAVASLRNQMATQHIELSVDVDPALPEVVLDYAQIEQVLLALLSNAIEAMPSGGRIAVSGRLTADGRRIRLEVDDNGPGIPAEQLPRIFKLFFTTKSSGTGFGLAVAKKIVERHGGTIGVESTVGQGTRFAIELPVSGVASNQ